MPIKLKWSDWLAPKPQTHSFSMDGLPQRLEAVVNSKLEWMYVIYYSDSGVNAHSVMWDTLRYGRDIRNGKPRFHDSDWSASSLNSIEEVKAMCQKHCDERIADLRKLFKDAGVL